MYNNKCQFRSLRVVSIWGGLINNKPIRHSNVDLYNSITTIGICILWLLGYSGSNILHLFQKKMHYKRVILIKYKQAAKDA